MVFLLISINKYLKNAHLSTLILLKLRLPTFVIPWGPKILNNQCFYPNTKSYHTIYFFPSTGIGKAGIPKEYYLPNLRDNLLKRNSRFVQKQRLILEKEKKFPVKFKLH